MRLLLLKILTKQYKHADAVKIQNTFHWSWTIREGDKEKREKYNKDNDYSGEVAE